VILVLKQGISPAETDRLKEELRSEGHLVKEIKGVEETILGVVGTIRKDPRHFETLPGVAKAVPISKPYKLVSRELHPAPSIIRVGDVAIGGDRLVVIAGPCAVESRGRSLEIARAVKSCGAVLFRGGAFKPRTSPYSFQGLGEEGLKILAEVREETGMGVVTEMTSTSQADLMMKYVDVVQVGARNMQNFELLKCVGRIGKPVLLKRGLAATIEEWLMSAEYILSEGNDQVILCERGIRTFERYTRNTLDLTAVPVIHALTHLPIIIDPSHATGIREKVSPMARAAIAAGADGLTIEVHTEPDKALSDGPQSLYPEQFKQLMRDLYVIAPVVGKQLDFSYLEKAKKLKATSAPPGKRPRKVVYPGEPGSFSHKACMHFFGAETPHENRSSFRAVFEAVREGEAALGIIPVENSSTGSVHDNYDLLLEYDVRIVGEVTLRIEHNLIGQPGTPLADLRRIYLNDIVTSYLKTPEFGNLSISHSKTSLGTELADDLLNVKGSALHLSKVIMNLVGNAAEAMPAGGTIRICTRNRYLDTATERFERIPEGEYVLLRITDEGVGIPAEELPRIFEPFYSKKKMGRSGSGLGMTVVWNTIKDHGGFVDIQSQEGVGTRFDVFLPATREENDRTQHRVVLQDYTGTERLLVVDDIQEQRDIAVRMLGKLGYQVAPAAGGEEAVAYLQAHTVDLVVLDMVMPPGFDGLETYRRILDFHPGQKAIIVSGYSPSERVKAMQHLGAGEYIRKPYTLEKIGLAVRRELDRKPA